ncbi:hypothetical protein HMPREF3190_01385 [Umbribacter vaginalis]|nr:hypothetical protein HMPREF3190_01385 [Coriobacteriales bacterium DNF00809]
MIYHHSVALLKHFYVFCSRKKQKERSRARERKIFATMKKE